MKGPALGPSKFATLVEALASAAKSQEGLTFVDLDERERFLGFAELQLRASRVAHSLARLGIVEGDRVALVLPTGESFMDAFFGALLAGAVPVPLYPPVRLGRLEEYHASTARMLTLSGARVVVTDGRVGKLLGESVRRALPPFGCHRVDELLAGSGSLERRVTADELGLIQFSSGSTVDPKPVALSHRQLLAQLEALRLSFPAPRIERHLGVSWLPLYHDMGLIGSLLSAIYYPGPLVLIPPEHFLARPSLWLRAISRHRATISSAPNFAYALCLKRVSDADREGLDLSSWQLALNGAEPVSVPVMRRFVERFAPNGFHPEALMPVYGLSEAALAVTFAAPDGSSRPLAVDAERLAIDGEVETGTREIACVGRPMPGCEVEVRDDLGAVMGEGQLGRVFVRAPYVMRGYFEQPEATARALEQGWLDTGDLGFVRAGELFVCGRAKDVVIIRGANRAPQEFEDALEGIEGLRPGCAVALGFVPPDGDGEALLILAERAQGADGERDEAVRQAAREAVLAKTAIAPHTVELLAPGTLPRTSSGKLRRAEALRRYLAGTLTAPRNIGTLGVMAEIVRSAISYARAGIRRSE